MTKRILWVQPVAQTRGAKQANPGCTTLANIQIFTPVPAGTGLAYNDTLAGSVTLAPGFACTYSVTNGTPTKPSKVGTYTITVVGVLSQNYDVRYKTGTLTVTP